MTTPTPYDCPDTKQVPDNCDKCEQTTTITCIPTTTVCNSNFISEDICCSSGGPARNGSTTFGQLIRSIPPTTAEDCCRACYKDSNCTTYYFYNSDDGTDCGLYNNEGLCYQLSSTPTENEEYGEVGCGLCKP
ncbi:12752_t:CDS:1 [Cetraspora pellucida]|uniref:12752_t:CDS:1 n=1 Tax=Cetraspora pellucida TaxID=1433469 RepID=A0A9N9ELT8_9GLOM|nr:12752_t:CDS:1 [Cetraspora pellucida]